MAHRVRPGQVAGPLDADTTFEAFFAEARLNPKPSSITGVVCGARVEPVVEPVVDPLPTGAAGDDGGLHHPEAVEQAGQRIELFGPSTVVGRAGASG